MGSGAFGIYWQNKKGEGIINYVHGIMSVCGIFIPLVAKYIDYKLKVMFTSKKRPLKYSVRKKAWTEIRQLKRMKTDVKAATTIARVLFRFHQHNLCYVN